MRNVAVRVLVLDDSPRRRSRLQRLVATDARLQIVATAADGIQAVQAMGRVDTDVILAGCIGPESPSIESIGHIMHVHPLPIVALSDTLRSGEDKHAFDVLEAGAVAVFPDPGEGGVGGDAVLESLRLMSEVKVVRRWKRSAVAERAAQKPTKRAARGSVDIVVIGASTGGPIVLKQVLASLPRSFPAPIVVVQHMAAGFVHGLAHWLNSVCEIPARVIEDGIRAEPGRVYLAADGSQLRITEGHKLSMDAGTPVSGHRPAVACLFESARVHHGSRVVAVLLTGMGTDGAAELKGLKDAGAVTIAQDPATCAVPGMPAEAIRRGGATYVMSPQQIAAALPTLVD